MAGQVNGKMVQETWAGYSRNLREHPIDVDGLQWYHEQECWIRIQSKQVGMPWRMFAGLVAVCSPMKRWDKNKEVALQVATSKTQGIALTSGQRAKAISFAAGIIPPRLGPKERAFWHNLCGCYHSVTVDRHHMAAMLGYPLDVPSGKLAPSTPKAYRLIEQMTQEIAAERGYTPAQFQAGIWVYRQSYSGPGKRAHETGQDWMDRRIADYQRENTI